MGVGPSNARIMLLGESPGEEEDKKGIPFIGKSGKMLDSILIELGLNREDMYVTNTIKCHPLFNHPPNVSQIETCTTAYLRKEIQEINPELIICLGGHAAKALLADHNVQIISVRQQVHYTQGPFPKNIPFIVTYHPAATFHKPELLEFIVQDFEFAKGLLKGKLPAIKKKANYEKITSLNNISELGVEETKWLDLDLETDGLDPFIPDKKILSLQISVKKGVGYYLDWSRQIGRELKDVLANENFKVNGHNIKFDLKWLRMKAGIIFDGGLNDTIQNIHLLDENFPNKSLDIVSATFTELKGYKGKFVKLINDYIKMHKEKKEPITQARARLWGQAYKAIALKTRIAYGCGDADATGRLRRVFIPRLEQEGLTPLNNLMMNATKMFVDVECNGIKIDEGAIEDIKDIYSIKLDRLLNQLDILAPIELNHNAPLQLRQLLYGIWKLTPHEVRMGKKRVKYTTAKDALDLILKDDITDDQRSYITQLMEYKKISKLYGTYITGMPRYLRDGFIHATWNMIGADTGRLSCNDPNLQQIPRTGDIKGMFISRYDDGVLMQIDSSQGELRIAAHMSNEKNLIYLFNHGDPDIHRAVAASIFHKLPQQVTDIERHNGKTIDFAVLYGSGIKTIAQGMKGATEKEAYQLIRGWHKQFPGWKEYVKKVTAFVIEHGYVRDLFGRYRRLVILEPDSPEGQSSIRKAVNSPIQGGLSNYILLAGYNAWVRIKRKYPEVLFVLQVHDSWVLDMPKRYIPTIARILKEEFENVNTSEFGFKFKVPMKIDIKIGPNWKEMEDYAR
jgi:DNA polymerase-1